MPATYYPAIIDRSTSGFGASFPDFPGCIASGGTIHEAALNAEAALALHVEGMVKEKDALPEPSLLDAIEAGADGADDVACVLIRVEVPVKVERVLISLDAGLLRAIDAVASNRSAWMADAARAALHAEARGIQLPKQPIPPPARQYRTRAEATAASRVMVNLSDAYQVRYWADSLGVPEDRLREIARAAPVAGSSAPLRTTNPTGV